MKREYDPLLQPILPYTAWLSMKFMSSTERANLRRHLARGLSARVGSHCGRPAVILDTPRVEPHNCISNCGVKTNWIVYEMVDAETHEHVGNFGTCLQCNRESGFCDYPDAGWGVDEPTFDESAHAEQMARLCMAGKISQSEFYERRYQVPERPLQFCVPWRRVPAREVKSDEKDAK